MNVPDKLIRVGLVSELETLTYEGSPLKVYAELVPPDAAFPRVVIKSVSSRWNGSKSQDMYETDFSIQIEDRRTNAINANTVDEIADMIASKLEPARQTNYFAVDGFTIWSIAFTASTVSSFYISPNQYINKNLRITIKTEKNV